MKSSEDRRSASVQRVSVAALVDICNQAGDGSPFQAESCNVSGRGMQVRTSFLPDIGEELVCRFNLGDDEVLVEGRVAWRSEGEDSGEFGIQFTALDADSADVLQAVGEPAPRIESVAPPASVDIEEDEEERELSSGGRVKLHIDGLGAPMKACVHEGTSRKVRVGSSLEFLKMGRALQVEDMEGGGSRGASVDAVNVVINPSTSVPELVVQLRYEGMSPTPPPAEASEDVLDYEDTAFHSEVSSDALSAPELGEEEASSWEPAAEALRARLGGAVESAGSVAHKASGVLGNMAKSAKASVVTAVASRRGGAAPEPKKTQPQSPDGKRRVQAARRRTRAPSHLRSGIHDMGLAGKTRRPQKTSVSPSAPSAPPKKKRMSPAVMFGGAFIVLAGSAFGLRQMSDESPEVAANEAAVETTGAQAPAEQSPVAKKVAAKAKADRGAVPKKEGVVAEVPLFGPQAMAVKPAETKTSKLSDAVAERRAAAASVPDQTWDEPAKEVKVEQSKPWGKGRLYLPTIHRIRLDGAGAALSGAINSDGFTIVVPGRKAMESGKAIQKRDKRIMAVETNNNARGATVKFEFRGPVPPYRVRLRQDFVEFLVSAPEETVARL